MPALILNHARRNRRRPDERRCGRRGRASGTRAAAGLGLLLALIAATAEPASAHGAFIGPDELWTSWTLDWWILASVFVPAWLYAFGLARLWERAGVGRGVRRWQAWCFLGGVVALVVALISPLDALGGALFSAHMLQHMVLMLVAAPLLVLGNPPVAIAWALPPSWHPWIAAWSHLPGIRATVQASSHPAVAWVIHAVALWVWHVPVLYQATLTSELVHLLQHASFLGTALIFWWAALEFGRRQRMRYGLGSIYVFTTALHSSILGALLTFSLVIWYPIYADRTAAWGLTPLEDQQLGGLVMWVPAGVIYLVAALALLAAGLRPDPRSAQRPGARPHQRPDRPPRPSAPAAAAGPPTQR